MPMELDVLTKNNQQDIQLPQITEDQQKEIEVVRSIWKDWRTWFESNHKERIRGNYRRINATVADYEDVDDEWRGINGHPVRLAIEYGVAETYKTRILKALVGNQELVKINPNKKTTVRNADLMNKLVYHFMEKDVFTEKLITLVDQAVQNGSVPWLVYQKQEKEPYEEQVRVDKPFYLFGRQIMTHSYTETRTGWKFSENRPCFEVYDIETVGFNQTLGKYEASPYHIFRQLLHRSQLRQMYSDYAVYFDSGLLDWSGADDYTEERQGEIGKSTAANAKKSEGRIETFYWLEPEGTVVVFSDKLVIKIPNPSQSRKKESFTGLLNILPKSFEPYGYDLITLASQFADLWNEGINIAVDSSKLANTLITKIKKAHGVEMDTIWIGPGNQWIMDDLKDVEVVQPQYQPDSMLKVLGAIDVKDQQVHGASNITQSTPADAKFATDIQRMLAESNYRFWLAILHIRLEMKKIVRAYVKHIQEYVAPTISPDNPLVFMVTGEKGFDEQEINNPEDLEGDFDYKISLEIEDLDRNLVRAQLMNAIDIITKNPALAPFANPPELLKLVFKMFPNVKDLENLVGSPQEQLIKTLEKLQPRQLIQVVAMIQELVKRKAMEAQAAGGPGQPGAPSPAASAPGVTRVPVNPQALAAGANRMDPQSAIAGANIKERMF